MIGGDEERDPGGRDRRVQYALELYLPLFAPDPVREAAAKARDAAEQIQRRGTAMRFVRAIFMLGDEICLLVFEAASAELVAEAARRVGIIFERVIEVEVDPRDRRAADGATGGAERSQTHAGEAAS